MFGVQCKTGSGIDNAECNFGHGEWVGSDGKSYSGGCKIRK